jgi:hypothetical protein
MLCFVRDYVGSGTPAGMLSAWLLSRWDKQRHWTLLALSGTAMAMAVQIKLTAVLIMPAVFVEFLLLSCACVLQQPAVDLGDGVAGRCRRDTASACAAGAAHVTLLAGRTDAHSTLAGTRDGNHRVTFAPAKHKPVQSPMNSMFQTLAFVTPSKTVTAVERERGKPLARL